MEKVEKDAVEGEKNSQNPEEEVVWNGGAKKLPPGIFDIWDPLSFLSHPLRKLPSLNPTQEELEAITAGPSSSNENLCKFYDGVSGTDAGRETLARLSTSKKLQQQLLKFSKLGQGVREEKELDKRGVVVEANILNGYVSSYTPEVRHSKNNPEKQCTTPSKYKLNRKWK